MKKSMSNVSSKYHIEIFKVLKLLKLYKANLRKLIALNRKNKSRKLKLTESVIESIREFWKESKDKAYSLGQIRLYLKALHPQEWDISVTTISRAMTISLHMSHKKLNKIHKSWLTANNKRNIFDAAYLQWWLDTNDILVIYIDEFKYSSESSNTYGWTQKGQNGHFKYLPSKFESSFIIAVSKLKIHGLMASKITYNSNKFLYFMAELVKTLSDNFAILLDNASIHKTTIIQEFCKSEGVWMITIPSYWPFLSPWEKAINNIKRKVKSKQNSGKMINLKSFKTVIDDVKPQMLTKCVVQSRQETYDLLRSWLDANH